MIAFKGFTKDLTARLGRGSWQGMGGGGGGGGGAPSKQE